MSLFHYIGDIVLTSDGFSDLEAAVQNLKEVVLALGWAVNKEKVQGLGFSVKFLGIILSSKMKIIPNSVIDKMQAHHRPVIVCQFGVCGLARILADVHTAPCYTSAPFIPSDLEGCYKRLDRCRKSCFLGLREDCCTCASPTNHLPYPNIYPVIVDRNGFGCNLW